MNESNARNFEKPSDFWRAIRSWVRWTIVIGGLALGVSVWLAVWGSAMPLALLFFVAATGTSALIIKIAIAGLFVLSVPVAVLLIPWLFFQLVYGICSIAYTASQSESFGDFIFRK